MPSDECETLDVPLLGKRIGLGRLALLPARGEIERLECSRLVVMQDRIELVRQSCQEVAANTLGLWPLDRTDSPLQTLLPQRGSNLALRAASGSARST